MALALLIKDDGTTLRAQYSALAESSDDEYDETDIADFAKAVPVTISAHLDQMYLLGAAGHKVLSLVAMIHSNRAMLENTMHCLGTGALEYEVAWDSAVKLANRGMDTCRAAEEGLGELFKDFKIA